MHEAGEIDTGKLRELIYKQLKGKRYLIVIDDIWSEEAWNDIRICFPDDNLGSRILVTSRLMNVIKTDSLIYRLRFLTVEESWDLLQHKIFAAEEDHGTCPINLQKVGKQIAERRRGSGLLTNAEKSVKFWSQVSDSIGSYIASDPEQYMNTLSLSYNHLPQHLKSCFLYFGAFKEDFLIDVRKLMWLWVAEGFVRPGTENVAEGYLIDLIERSLVIVYKQRSDGGVKYCRVHDLLRDFCLKKSKEEKLLREINIKPYSGPGSSTSIPVRRLSIHNNNNYNNDNIRDYVSSKPFSPCTHSFLYVGSYFPFPGVLTKENISFIYSAFKHIRVLALESAEISFLPPEIGQLIQLRYLSLHTRGHVIPESISTLRNLQTLVVSGDDPFDFQVCKDSSMSNLMHIRIRPSMRLHYHPMAVPVSLPKLKTISMLHLPSGRHPVLEMAPNLKKLGCVVSQKWNGSVIFPTLDGLIHLQKLKIEVEFDFNYALFPNPGRFTCLNRLPHNLKKVTISKLKFLKIQSPELVEWNMSTDHFPALEKLVMDGCNRLKEIPMCLGDIPTLRLIELDRPSSSAADRLLKNSKVTETTA